MGPGSWFSEVFGYEPRHIYTAASLAEQDGDRLRALRGERLVRSFVVWDVREREWFRDGPAILDFGVTRFEIAGFKDYLCVSWDSIDVTRPIDWDDDEHALEWRANALPELHRMCGRTIDAVRIVEYQGALSGVQFCSGSVGVELFNTLDELEVADAFPPDPAVVRRDV